MLWAILRIAPSIVNLFFEFHPLRIIGKIEILIIARKIIVLKSLFSEDLLIGRVRNNSNLIIKEKGGIFLKILLVELIKIIEFE
jgi:hypothetical protein